MQPQAGANAACLLAVVSQLTALPAPRAASCLQAELSAAAAREAVQLVLSRLPTSQHAQVLRLRHRLGEACQAVGPQELAAGQRELDFTAVGRQLGVSRQRAQVLYRAAVDAARQQAQVLGLC